MWQRAGVCELPREPRWPTVAADHLATTGCWGEKHGSNDITVSRRVRRRRSNHHRRCGARTNLTADSASGRSARVGISADCDHHDSRLSRSGACRFQAARHEPAERQEAPSAAGDARYHAMGLVRQCASSRAAGQFRRHRRAGNDDAQPQPGRSGHDHRADQEDAHRFSRSRAAHVDRTHLHRGGAARRRPQSHAQQDRAARLCDELQRARHVRPIPDRLFGRAGQIPVPRPR